MCVPPVRWCVYMSVHECAVWCWQAADNTAADNAIMDKGEFLVLTLDFGVDNTAVFSPATINPSLVALGVPASGTAGVETLGSARVGRLTGSSPRNGFGATITTAAVTVYNFVPGSSTLVGPDAAHPHLELAVSRFSTIAAALATTAGGTPNTGIKLWDPTVPCVAVSAMAGSLDDGPVGEDSVSEQQNCPSPSPSPSPAPVPSASPTVSVSPRASPSSPPRTSGITFTGNVTRDFPVSSPGVCDVRSLRVCETVRL